MTDPIDGEQRVIPRNVGSDVRGVDLYIVKDVL